MLNPPFFLLLFFLDISSKKSEKIHRRVFITKNNPNFFQIFSIKTGLRKHFQFFNDFLGYVSNFRPTYKCKRFVCFFALFHAGVKKMYLTPEHAENYRLNSKATQNITKNILEGFYMAQYATYPWRIIIHRFCTEIRKWLL